MQRLTADARREIIDWIVAGRSGGEFYGDGRDIPPSDWDLYSLHQWQGWSHTAKLNRGYLEKLSDEDLEAEATNYYELRRSAVALMPRRRGRPSGAGSLQEADQPFVDQIRQLNTGGLSAHAAARRVAAGAPGHGSEDSKVTRLYRRFLEKKSG
jgi:hypothetical protein